MLRWIRPWTWSVRLSAATRSSKARMRHIVASRSAATSPSNPTEMGLGRDGGLAEHLVHGVLDLFLVGEQVLLHWLAVGDRGLERGHMLDWRLQRGERVRGDLARDHVREGGVRR